MDTSTLLPLPSVDAEAIRREFLSPDAEATRPLELSEAAKQDLLTPDEPEETPRTEVPLDPVLGTAAPNEARFVAWLMQTSDIGDIKVEQHEKAIFLKAALNDEQVELDITLPLGDDALTITCRTLNTAEMSLMFAALNQDEKDGKFRDPAQYVSAMQAYAISMQITAINSRRVDHFTTTSGDIEALRHHTVNLTGRTNHMRWHYLLLALRIFTIKTKLCTDAALNRDFWQTAGTD